MVIFFLLFFLAGGLTKYLKTPKVYQCTSLIKYQRQRVNPTAMSPDDIRSRTQDAVATISQEITSRSSLEAMIKEFNLYVKMRANLPMEDVVDVMREKHIQIGQDRGDIFKVSYQGADPKKVLRVTNALGAKFIEENLRFREERASETSAYIQDELRMSKAALDKKEAVMRDYKLQYYNEMPDQRQNNMNRLNALQEQYQNNQTSVLDLERTKILVQEQISVREELLVPQSSGAGMFPLFEDNEDISSDSMELSQLRSELKSLLSRYTKNHPQVKRLQKRIDDLEAASAEQDSEVVAAENENRDIEDFGFGQGFKDIQIEQLKMQLTDLEFNIVRLKKDRKMIEEQIERFQSWVEAAPVREAEWASLTRDYEQLHQHYQALVAQSLQAESAYSLEKQQKGSQFKIVDPAHFPEKPFKPDFKKIMLLALGLGFGVGGGLALGLELIDASFKEPEDLESYLGVPVVCAVPCILTEKEQKKKKIWKVFWIVFFLCSVAAIVVATVYFWKQGMIIL